MVIEHVEEFTIVTSPAQNNITMKVNAVITLLALLTSSSFAQDKINSDELIGTRWVLFHDDPNVQAEELDTLIFYPYKSSKTDSLHPAIKYAGISFESNGVFIEHIWNKCGTGNPPDHYMAEWYELENGGGILMIGINESRKWDGEYTVCWVTAKQLTIVNSKRK